MKYFNTTWFNPVCVWIIFGIFQHSDIWYSFFLIGSFLPPKGRDDYPKGIFRFDKHKNGFFVNMVNFIVIAVITEIIKETLG